MSRPIRLLGILVLLMSSCSEDGDGPGADVVVPGEVPTVAHDAPTPVDPGELPDQADDPGFADDPGLDDPVPDPGGPEDIGPLPADPGSETVGDSGAGDLGSHPEAVAYGACTADRECPEGLICDLPFADAQHGFCSRRCNHESECPPSTLPIPVGCHKEPGATSGWCVSLCGMRQGGGTLCEDWLRCTASQWCLPPSTTVPTKGPGESCQGGAECLSGECIEGQNTRAHCALQCTSDADCAGPQGRWKGTCVTAAGLPYHFCIWMCGMMGGGAVCPGDLQCVGMSVCQ